MKIQDCEMADGNRSFLKSEEDRVEDPHVFVYDRRKGENPPKKIAIGGVFTYAELVSQVSELVNLYIRIYHIPHLLFHSAADSSIWSALIST